ncbi:MAG: hypothetical protein A2541_02725 [Candidatus Taylorbacteria bacterium RIFOXYD2_FULL_36_9]|uniref:Uncharacterized protein n=1 Tax=Candidatus Taylorbacteria bacterium RIFOXYD2_FULL_36_9 TaxID=1802338 RepID=A0A1G2PFF2_9BACT|nr:MAG: hypothetical protein A2541_02725 [Candidatus Taylorbacteria bacterium RIFOXYD2_FULL_36_9]
MATFVVFITALVLISFLFLMKSFELRYGRKIFLENLFLRWDASILKALSNLKYWWSHVSFKNTKLFFSWFLTNIKQSVIIIKRRFDHKQSHFFAKREFNPSKNKSSVSFFLKNVSDYKKSLREGKEGK